VYYRLSRDDGYVFDFDDDTWEVNLAACTTPKLSATERSYLGDADYSRYDASVDLSLLNNSDASRVITAEALNDLATDELIGTVSFCVAKAENLGPAPAGNISQIAGASNAASMHSKAATGILTGAVAAGTASAHSFPTNLAQKDTDHYINRGIIMLSGDLAEQHSWVTGSTNAATVVLTVTGFTAAPSAADEFALV
jgi:hypothetical protein